MYPYRIQFDTDDMAFIVITNSADEAYDLWLADRVSDGSIGMLNSAAADRGQTIRELADVFALPLAGGSSFYSDRI